eukprot:348984_1
MTFNKTETKKRIGILIVGHVDAGKTTTKSRLMFEFGGMNERDLQKLRKESQQLGLKESQQFLYLIDKYRDRPRGITIQSYSREFFTNSYHYTIIEPPGSRDLLRNLLSGSQEANVALLVIPANKGAFETSIAKPNPKRHIFEGHTRSHSRLCHLLGIKQIIVCINKMDHESVNYSEERYNEIKHEINKLLTKIGYKTKRIPFIPISCLKGDNIKSVSEHMRWYKGFTVKIKKQSITGHTLLDALENVVRPPKRKFKKPFRMSVSGVYKIKGVGDVITGRIEQGTILPNATVEFIPSGSIGQVVSIEMHHKKVNLARHGDNCGLHIRDLPKSNMPKVGDIMVIDDIKLDPNPPRIPVTFTAIIWVQNHPGKLMPSKINNINLKLKINDDKELCKVLYSGGFTSTIHIRTAKALCKMIDIQWKMGRSTKNMKLESPKYIEAGDHAQVTFCPIQPIVALRFDECENLGRVAVMQCNSLVMLGKVVSCNYRKSFEKVVHKYINHYQIKSKLSTVIPLEVIQIIVRFYMHLFFT